MRLTLVSMLLGTALGIHHGQPTATNSTKYNNLTVAIVRAPPANWPLPVMNKNWTDVKFDLNQTVVKATHLIEDAANAGANLVVFPELWFPGYPKGIADSTSMKDHIQNYFDNSLIVGSPQWDTLITAAKHNQVYIVPAFSHREGDLIYMAQALISPEGEVLLLRHKLRPSGGEREIWSDGTIEDLKVIATPYGRWGLLECWEHFHPAMTFNVQSQKETLHIASWPFTPNEGDSDALAFEAAEVNVAAARTYAVNTGAPLAFASVGNVRFIGSDGLDGKVVNASVSFEDVPLVFASFNTTGLAETAPYDADAEQSWGILGQINAGFPSYIPNVLGKLVPRRKISISKLLARAG
ncbi:hypothetical protein PCG10_001847 [Penicillium crustosum]|uniref:nitrilase n=1 Tax=Penicillium crustosum TaxID=36656 RepID=A0A9P5L073_PENCR|nr:uncharacterized protein N7487_003188 [Penicillium crustosum]KAF7527914.1 hypothetical protein PCG10_001847 [Penicillium crustosum]KAJ5419638.1 hypothetical protein N7487_003188 [Penicillium crustosum]